MGRRVKEMSAFLSASHGTDHFHILCFLIIPMRKLAFILFSEEEVPDIF